MTATAMETRDNNIIGPQNMDNSTITIDFSTMIDRNVEMHKVQKVISKKKEWPSSIDYISQFGETLKISSYTTKITDEDWEELFKLLRRSGFLMLKPDPIKQEIIFKLLRDPSLLNYY